MYIYERLDRPPRYKHNWVKEAKHPPPTCTDPIARNTVTPLNKHEEVTKEEKGGHNNVKEATKNTEKANTPPFKYHISDTSKKSLTISFVHFPRRRSFENREEQLKPTRTIFPCQPLLIWFPVYYS